MKTSIVVPCYNEESSVEEFYYELKKHILTINSQFEILFINDGSEDKTETKIINIAETDKNVKLVSFIKNFGHQKALKAGIDKSEGDVVITIDCDFQQPITLIKEFIKEWDKVKFLVVHGIKKTNKTNFLRSFVVYCAYKIINFCNSNKIDLNGSDFFLLDKKVVNDIKKVKTDNMLIRSFVSIMNYEKKKIFYNLNERKHGKSKYTIRKFFNIFILALLHDYNFVKKKSKLKQLINHLFNKKNNENYVILKTKNIND